MPSGIKYISFAEPSGYGLSAVAYVRGLVNAGIPVQWVSIEHYDSSIVPLQSGSASALFPLSRDDAALNDLPALLDVTSRHISYDTVVAHTVPEHWPAAFEPNKRNVGYTVWETDAPPPHWAPLLNESDKILVPCEMNRASFEAAGVVQPIHVVPHIRRHAWSEFSPSEIDAMSTQLGIPQDHFVFYSINAWDPRKALPLLLRAFVHAFSADDPVTLILKVPPTGFGQPPFYQRESTVTLAQAAIDAATAETNRPPPSICLLPYELSGRGIDLLHELGDCYVSLSHGEGWALGAFDAATRGTPVVMTGWGGHLDYLGEDWPGRIPYRLGVVPVWPPSKPSYWPSQRWAIPDFDAAVAALRQARAAPARDAAAEIQSRISDRYAEPVVTKQFLAALDD